jgi:hypothetical protein
MWVSLGVSTVAICALVFGMYLPRHHRGEIAAAYLVIGLGLAAIMVSLRQASTIGAGFGLGILGVLSVFRLRSIEIDHHDVAYFFCTLSIGIVGGLTIEPMWLTPVLCLALLGAVFVGDHHRITSRNLRHTILLDKVHTDHGALTSELAALLGAHVHRVDVREIDTLKQTTLVDVRFTRPAQLGTSSTTR